MTYTILACVMAAFAAGYVVESAWRLRRHRPARYLSVPGELFIAATLIIVMFVSMPTQGPVDILAKSIATVGFTVGAVLRIIARQRFAVQT